MANTITFDLTKGAGVPASFLIGTIEIEPTGLHIDGTTLVLPTPDIVPIVNGTASVDLAPSPAGDDPAWAYRIVIRETKTKRAWSEIVRVPDVAGPTDYTTLERLTTSPAAPPLTTWGEIVAEAAASATAAQGAEAAAVAAAGLVGAPAGSAVLAAISEGGAARGELNAAIDASPSAVVRRSLMPTGTKIAWLGDSNFRGSDTEPGIEAATIFFRGNSIPTSAALATNGRVRVDINAGIFGNKSADMLARVQADVIARNPTTCILMAGSNDAGASVPLADFKTNMLAIIDALLTANIRVFVVTPMNQRGVPGINGYIKQYRDWELADLPKLGVPVLDLYGQVYHATNGVIGDYFDVGDGVHPNIWGRQVLGRWLGEQLVQYFPQREPRVAVQAAGPGNLFGNATFDTGAETSGRANGLNWWGSAPAGATASTTTAVGVVGKMQRITQAGGAEGKLHRYLINTPAPGSKIRASGIITASGIRAQVQFFFVGAPTGGWVNTAITAYDGTDRARWEAEFEVPSGTTQVSVWLTAGTGTGYAEFGQLRVEVPSTAKPVVIVPSGFTDSFERADGSFIGSTTTTGGLTWQVYGPATGTITGGDATVATTGTGAAYVDAGFTDGTIKAQIVGTPGTGRAALVARMADLDNFLNFAVDAGGQWGLNQRIANVASQITGYTLGTAAAGDVLELVLSGTSGTVKINGVQKWTGTIPAISGGTKYGWRTVSTDTAAAWEYIEFAPAV